MDAFLHGREAFIFFTVFPCPEEKLDESGTGMGDDKRYNEG